MTTGEKITQLRKNNNYTQEELACILNVSRQSVSKWESDGAFPETEKLIQLSKLFHCSVDYLLKEECDTEFCKYEKEVKELSDNNEKKTSELGKEIKRNLPFKIVMLSFGIASLLFFIAPWIHFRVWSDNYYANNNLYQLIILDGTVNVIGKFLFSAVIVIILFDLIFFFVNNSLIHSIILISSFIVAILTFSFCLTVGNQITFMPITYCIISIILCVLLLTVKELKFDINVEKKKIKDFKFVQIYSRNLGFNIISFITIIFVIIGIGVDFYSCYEEKSDFSGMSYHLTLFNTRNVFTVILMIVYLLTMLLQLFTHISCIVTNKKVYATIYRWSNLFIAIFLFVWGIIISLNNSGKNSIYYGTAPVIIMLVTLLSFFVSFIPLFNFKKENKNQTEGNLIAETN